MTGGAGFFLPKRARMESMKDMFLPVAVDSGCLAMIPFRGRFS
jgi:hypothetical protein